jgi:hypothetical protein
MISSIGMKTSEYWIMLLGACFKPTQGHKDEEEERFLTS